MPEPVTEKGLDHSFFLKTSGNGLDFNTERSADIIIDRLKITPPELESSLVNIFDQFSWQLKPNTLTVFDVGYQKLNVGCEILSQQKQIKPIHVNFYPGIKKQSLMNEISFIKSLEEKEIPVPHIYRSPDGKTIFSDHVGPPHGGKFLTAVVMDHFLGKDFNHVKSTDQDLTTIVGWLPKIHEVDMGAVSRRDTWFPLELGHEYEERQLQLDHQSEKMLKPIIKRLAKLDTAGFELAFGHLDIQKAHVLINRQKNKYCLIDFGVSGIAPRVVDLAITAAHFGLEPGNSKETDRKINLMIETYNRKHHIPNDEKQAIKLIIAATYGTFYFHSYIKVHQHHQTDRHTLSWLEFGLEGLKQAKALKY